MSQSNKQWLLKQLPELRSKEILDEDAIDRLREYYGLNALPVVQNGLSKMTMILSAIGGLLVGGGVIMMFAHNWDNFGRNTRVILALLPLIASQIFVFLALVPKQRSIAWREASAAFMFCTVPASIAIVGQAYHISDDAQAFQTLWFLLILPFVYLLRVTLTAILMMLLATQMAFVYQGLYWLCAASLLPFFFLKEPLGRNRENASVGWVFAIGLTLSFCAAIFIDVAVGGSFESLLFISAAACVFLLGGMFEQNQGLLYRPFSTVGAVSMAMVLLVWSFTDFWDHLQTLDFQDIAWVNYPIMIMVGLASIGFVVAVSKYKELLPMMSIWLLSIVFVLLERFSLEPEFFALIANVAAVVLSVWYIWIGIKKDSPSRMNFGLVLLMTIIIMRFFDQDFSFIVKGTVFIVLGVIFIAVNVWQNKRQGRQLREVSYE